MNAAIVTGLCTLDAPPRSVVVSPRNAEKALALHEAFPSLVRVAASNQEVVDSSDTVFIGVLPKLAEAVIRDLRFDERHTVVSLISTAPLDSLRKWLSPATASVVRAIPLPPVAKHAGTTLVTPRQETIVSLFDALGTAVPVDDEVHMQTLMPITCLMGQLYAQQQAAQGWLMAQGIDRAVAAKYVGGVFHTITHDSAAAGPDTLDHLVAEQTPGGLNEQVLRELTEAGAYKALSDSLDGALARIQQREARKLKKRPYSSMVDGGIN
eukprot:CAMPEP_0119085752 /NCGR_PEP_ID=MMETSP1178-20130426/135007_1 /TAXON_ID=33656 /ORGANISM="unid sp, Strain CCMP2000" /LENGTH=266 /DNA_ID=CAMNT_0007068839 /DNA_START=113 /DNA_END=913 /DNA_ORIENTATION=-